MANKPSVVESTKQSLSFFSLAPVAAFAVALVCGGTANAGMIITGTFDSSVASSFGANTAAMENAWNFAAADIASNFSDNIHVNITVSAVADQSVLGESNTSLISTSYANIRAHAVSDSTTADDAASLAAGGSLAAADPVTGSHAWLLSTAQAKALAVTADNLTNDGTTTFGAGFTYTFNSANRAVPGAIDFIGVAEHEITEVMGRISLLGQNLTGSPDYMWFDNFRFTANGTRNMTTTTGGVYFSIDNGATNLINYNFANGNGSDNQDWKGDTNDSFNAFSSSSVKNPMSVVDLQTMDVIGYDRTSTVPEPSTLALFGTALLAVGALRKHRS